MACLRRVKLTPLKTFKDLCISFVNLVQKLSPNAQRIDFVFDTYVEGSVKDSERLRRCECSPIEVNNLNDDTPLPVDMNAFWSCSSNKVKLQNLLREHILQIAEYQFSNVQVVISGTGIMGKTAITQCVSRDDDQTMKSIPRLDVDIEEADVRLIPHAMDAVTTGTARIVVLSNDTDVLVLLLYYWRILFSHGLKELWMRGGVGDSIRYIPVHTLATKIGLPLCQVLPAAHQLTGSDSNSKFGTKLGALKAKPELFLEGFGGDPNNINLEKAEEYLVQVIKPGVPFKSMDALRYYLYLQSKKTILELPPTSRATKGHILRAFYGTYIQLHCLHGHSLDALEYGYYRDSELLKPCENKMLVPDDLPTSCGCGKCARVSCACRSNNVSCCIYCNCKALGNNCCNPL